MITVDELKQLLGQVVETLQDTVVPVPEVLKDLNVDSDVLWGFCRNQGFYELLECCEDFVGLESALVAMMVNAIEARYYAHENQVQAQTIIRYAQRVDPLETELAGLKAMLPMYETDAQSAKQRVASLGLELDQTKKLLLGTEMARDLELEALGQTKTRLVEVEGDLNAHESQLTALLTDHVLLQSNYAQVEQLLLGAEMAREIELEALAQTRTRLAEVEAELRTTSTSLRSSQMEVVTALAERNEAQRCQQIAQRACDTAERALLTKQGEVRQVTQQRDQLQRAMAEVSPLLHFMSCFSLKHWRRKVLLALAGSCVVLVFVLCMQLP